MPRRSQSIERDKCHMTNDIVEAPKKKPYKLSANSFRLLKDEVFFAAISRAVQKVQNYSIPTAGVCINQSTGWFELHYNPDFFQNLGKTDENGVAITDPVKIMERQEKEACGVLKHEYYHLIFDHVVDRLPAEGMSRLWNIAADLAINGEIAKELPYTGCVPGRIYVDPVTKKKYKNFS